jgi:hypothetical protein
MSNVPISPILARNRKRKIDTTANLQFPSDLDQIGTLLLFKEYSFNDRELGSRGGIKNTSDVRAAAKIVDSLYLPLPEQMLDATSLKVQGNELGGMGNAAAKGVAAAKDSVGGSIDSTIKRFQDAVLNINSSDVATTAFSKFLLKGLSALGAEGLQSGIESGLGATINPYAAMTFEGVNLKTYTFNWLLAPKNRTESKTLKKIIISLKKNSLPYYKTLSIRDTKLISGRSFMGYPNVCLPIIAGVDTLVMKPCMISNFNIDYGAGGEIAFLEGGNPLAVKLELTLQEMQIWTREDYDGSKLADDDIPASIYGPSITGIGKF